MLCHYEVLAVARDASAIEIKKAFRLQALRWHPDKHKQNGTSSEEATKQFQVIQSAYEVLSNPHEKKWYDEHREQILRDKDSKNNEGEDDELNLLRFFNTSVYSGYGSDAKSFYSVYGDLFLKIDQLDLECGQGKRSAAAPAFGNDEASINAVNDFYNHWKSYTTQRTFAWMDDYQTTHASTRLVRRAMEKANEKVRDAAKKAYIIEVRELVEFVCRRDPRVQKFNKTKEQEKAQEMEKQRLDYESLKREKQAAYEIERRLFREHQDELWATSFMKTSHVADQDIEVELEKLRKKLDADVLACDLCNKVFKSTNQLQNHLFSKKHREKDKALCFGSVNDSDLDRALEDELTAMVKLKCTLIGESTTGDRKPDIECLDYIGKAAGKNAEAERVRIEKEFKAAERRRERKEMRKLKKKEKVKMIVNSAVSKQNRHEEEEERGHRRKQK
ncbi:uncharacterized protein CCR75_006415 [Bremia lactucae]|uniref:DnaJ homolog subfamily C member 21 n=1 Tax=Bremia lactucae TaxID=4779 RepID=A0A976FPH3_BRELC|nr:hypothetical protein CCR75_006415 [Bremia lactucae]